MSSPDTQHDAAAGTVLIVAAGRGLGHAMAGEFAGKGWHVIGTIRPGTGRTGLHELAEAAPGQVEIETLDINEPAQIAALRDRLTGRVLDIVIVNAGVTTASPHVTPGEVTAAEFSQVMITNALSPVRVVEALGPLVPASGVIAAMSSGQGSIGNNTTGQRDVYRASKAALNMLMRSFAARRPEPAPAMLVLAPGWIRTALGGPDAPFSTEETIPDLVSVILAQAGTGSPGLRFLDRFGTTVPW